MSMVLSRVAAATFLISGLAMFLVGISFVVEGLSQPNPWKLLSAYFIFCPLFLALIYSFPFKER